MTVAGMNIFVFILLITFAYLVMGAALSAIILFIGDLGHKIFKRKK